MSAMLKHLAKRISHLEHIRDLAAEAFEFTEDDLCVRRMRVVTYVADRLGVKPSVRLCRQVMLVGRGMGWVPINNTNRALFAHCRQRGVPDEVSRAETKACRKKVRNGV